MGDSVAYRIGAIAGRMSVGRRLLLVRASGIVAAVSAALMLTAALVPGSGIGPWTAVFGALLTVSVGVMGYQGSMLSRQLARELAGGYSTDRWAVSPRPEVAPGTSVIMRQPYAEPFARGEHRRMLDWAQRVESGSSEPAPLVAGDPTRGSRDSDLSGSVSMGIVAGCGSYLAVVLLMGLLLKQSLAIPAGVLLSAATVPLAALLHHVFTVRRSRSVRDSRPAP